MGICYTKTENQKLTYNNTNGNNNNLVKTNTLKRGKTYLAERNNKE